MQHSEVTIYEGTGQMNVSLTDAEDLCRRKIIYACGEKLKDCPFDFDPPEPEAICPFFHFTADFQADFETFDVMCNAVDWIMGRRV